MIKYIVADATGAILRSGLCPDADLATQAAAPNRIFSAAPSLYPTDHVDDTAWRVDLVTGRLTSASGSDGGALTPAVQA